MNPNSISGFEYITILISIILGLGITQLLSDVAEVFYNSKKIKLYMPHSIWLLVVLFLHVQEWFVIYELKDYPVWKLPTFLFIILYPIVLFITAKILFPVIEGEEKVNLKTYYFQIFPKLFYLFCTCILLSILFNLLFLHQPFSQQLLLLLPFFIFLFTAISKKQTAWIHWALSISVLLFVIGVTVVEMDAWRVQ